ncbi:MAG: acetylornithine deacetylase [Clostridiales bacterium]|nr:acetylornithine deacetylase [Clostridiales bacterium]
MKEYYSNTIQMLSDLISLPSVNPANEIEYDHNVFGEKAVVDYLENYFRKHKYHFYVEKDRVMKDRYNLNIYTEKNKNKKTLLLETHTDVVKGQNMIFPAFKPFVKDGKIFGRGSCDAKGQIAAMILGTEMALAQTNYSLPVNVCLAFVVDEEHLHRGVDRIVKQKYKADGAIVGEPTGLKIGVASKGSIRFKIATKGVAVHTSTPYYGKNAIYLMSKVINIIQQKLASQIEKNTHPLCNKSTICISIIQGGEQVNIVPDNCEIHVDRRLNPGEDWQNAYNDIKIGIEKELSIEERDRVVFFQPYLIDPSLETDTDSKIVKVSMEVLKKHELQYDPVGLNFGCDASKIALLDIPVIVFGPGEIQQAHSENEFVKIDDVIKASEVYRDIIINFDK